MYHRSLYRKGTLLLGLLVLGMTGFSAPAPAAEQALSARVLVSPLREARLSSELNGHIAALPLAEGKRFKTGDLLVALTCDLHEAALAESQALAAAANATLNNRRELAELRSVGQLDVALAEAEAHAADARVAQQRGLVRRCTIKAPFPGRVIEHFVHPYESVSSGEPLLSILDDSQLVLDMIVPSRWLSWLDEGTPLTVEIDETGSILSAIVERVGARIDAVSQSVPVRAIITAKEGSHRNLLAGMSGTALFSPSLSQ